MLDALEPYSLALLTRHYGWSFERVQVLLIGVRKEILNQKVHAYNNV